MARRAVPDDASDALAGPGTRAGNKADKTRRLTAAARDLFRDKGYDAATTRDIARLAGIAIGTVFTYARDKRDLLFLAVNDDIEAAVARMGARVPRGEGVAAQLADAFRPIYEFMVAELVLARFVLRERVFYEGGPQAERFAAARDRMQVHVAALVARWQDEGRLSRRHHSSDIARAAFALYAAEIRDLLGQPEPQVEHGLGRLAAMMRLLIEGAGG